MKVLHKKEDLKGLPPGNYVVAHEAAMEIRRQEWAIIMADIGILLKAREHSKDWQWPVRWHGTLCLLSERGGHA